MFTKLNSGYYIYLHAILSYFKLQSHGQGHHQPGLRAFDSLWPRPHFFQAQALESQAEAMAFRPSQAGTSLALPMQSVILSYDS